MEELQAKLKIQRDKMELDFEHTWDEFIDQNNDFIDRITASRHCRKCRKHWEQGQMTMAHHPSVVWNTAGGKERAEKAAEKKRQCKYVLFQQWLDFVLRHTDVLREWDEYREELKELLREIAQTKFLIPLLDWHYWQFFHEPLVVQPGPDDDEESRGDSIVVEIPEIVSEEEGDSRDEMNHRRKFLVFFIYFFTQEFGVTDDMEPISFESDLNMDLYMDPLSLFNLGDQIAEVYPEAVTKRFGELYIPMEFMFQTMTVGDLYTKLFEE